MQTVFRKSYVKRGCGGGGGGWNNKDERNVCPFSQVATRQCFPGMEQSFLM